MKAGITGHQNLGDQATIAWVRDTLADLLIEKIVSRGFTCLAEGADQLFADALLENDIPFTAIVPCLDYEQAFDNQAARKDYLRLIKLAGKRIELNFPYPSEKAFFEAGKKVVACSDLIYAVWDGESAKGLGGTGDIVDYSKRQSKQIVHLNPVTQQTTML